MMAKQFGLRTEIIVNLLVLMGAALLFSGFLLLNLVEREMVRGRIESASQQLQVAGRLYAELTPQASLVPPREALGASLAQVDASWLLVDEQLRIVAQSSPSSPRLHAEDVLLARHDRQTFVHLSYASVYFFLGGQGDDFARITVPLYSGQQFSGALQGRFPLASVKEELRRVGSLYLLYIVLYGFVLLAFGIWLLNKSIVRPVRQLTIATTLVSQGNLLQEVSPEGPKEIAELSITFNAMTQALRQSREETEESIRLLRGANDELQRAQHDLLRAERLASVGHLAAGMAHEVGNPLGAIIGYLHLLGDELSPGRQQDIASRAASEAGRIDRLVKELLDYAAPANQEAEAVDPVLVLGEALQLLRHQGVLAGIHLENTLPLAMPLVHISQDKLLQVLINLLCNARDAMSGQEATLKLHGGVDDDHVWLAIADNGSGMIPEALANIFDPFFTTKAPGQGRGLGLTVCHRIISEAGGSIAVQSQAGQGSTFTVRLPVL